MISNRYSEEDFGDFIQQLIDGQHFDSSKEEGIAKLVLDKGFEALSPKQQHVFEKSISYYVTEECDTCSNPIPWCEMYIAEDNGGNCSWCAHKLEKALLE